MHTYSNFGINDFVVCLGYKGYMIKSTSPTITSTRRRTFDLAANEMSVHSNTSEPWRVTLIDTGLNTMTGGRLRRVLDYVDNDFCFTYGDGLANLDVDALIDRHRRSGVIATVTAVKPPGRFGTLHLSVDRSILSQRKLRAMAAGSAVAFSLSRHFSVLKATHR